MGKILTEVKAFESRGGSRGAENSEYTYLVAAETNTQFHCPVCGNRVSSGDALLWFWVLELEVSEMEVVYQNAEDLL